MQTTIELSAGVAALVAVLINIFKQFNLVKADAAPTWSLALNLAGTALMLAFGLNMAPEQTASTNQMLVVAATALAAVAQLVGQLVVTWVAHKGLSAANIPFLGTSNTKRVLPKTA